MLEICISGNKLIKPWVVFQFPVKSSTFSKRLMYGLYSLHNRYDICKSAIGHLLNSNIGNKMKRYIVAVAEERRVGLINYLE
jgi:hypothetical protein